VGYFSRRQMTSQESKEELVVDFASETEADDRPEEEKDRENPEEAQYATIAPPEKGGSAAAPAKESGQVPCVKCRDIAIKLR